MTRAAAITAPPTFTFTLERSTHLAATAPAVWRHVTTPAGINAEFLFG